mmetsp:Transcript_52015/g.86676  ORF Transcript_52015/g.86676 Transcript_52015/m.86676 type:complete len:237 (+) Transcript_52015:72-782(+)
MPLFMGSPRLAHVEREPFFSQQPLLSSPPQSCTGSPVPQACNSSPRASSPSAPLSRPPVRPSGPPPPTACQSTPRKRPPARRRTSQRTPTGSSCTLGTKRAPRPGRSHCGRTPSCLCSSLSAATSPSSPPTPRTTRLRTITQPTPSCPSVLVRGSPCSVPKTSCPIAWSSRQRLRSCKRPQSQKMMTKARRFNEANGGLQRQEGSRRAPCLDPCQSVSLWHASQLACVCVFQGVAS